MPRSATVVGEARTDERELRPAAAQLAARCLDELLQLLVGVAVSQLVPVANLRAWRKSSGLRGRRREQN